MYGFHDRVGWVDLTSGRIEIRPAEPGDWERFVGGSNAGAAILARLTDGSTDPLGPGNPLIMMTGPFTGTKVPSAQRYAVVTLSPLTGIFAESNCGGSFGWWLKRAGLDGLVITGASGRPVVLVAGMDGLRLEDAGDLWGSEVYACDDRLKERFGPDITAAIIGPAGENQVRVAGIMHEGRHTRAAARCGVGAVMGSKRLKAVVVRQGGTWETPVHDPAGLLGAARSSQARIRERLSAFGANGTPGGIINYDRLGNLPINNWRDARAPELAARIGAPAIQEHIQVKRWGCRGCPIVCGRIVEVRDGPYRTDGIVEGPEYETLVALGSLQRNDDLKGIAKANELCNRLGVDTMSTGGIIAFANECWEKGLIGKADTDGLELGFGRVDVIIELIRRIAHGEGAFARLLGLGVREAARRIGGGAEECAMQVKGMEPAYHDPRFSWGQALSYATANRGPCHLATLAHGFELAATLPEFGFNEPHPGRQAEGKAKLVFHLQNFMNLMDSLIGCKFTMFADTLHIAEHYLSWYNQIVGRDLDLDRFMSLGERGFTLKRMINNRRGISRKDDLLPPRWRTLRKVGEGVNFGVPPIAPMLSDYYDLRGWTEEGRPAAATVRRLGLEVFG